MASELPELEKLNIEEKNPVSSENAPLSEKSDDGYDLYHSMTMSETDENGNVSAHVPVPEEGFSFIGVLNAPNNKDLMFHVGKYTFSTLERKESEQLSYLTPFQDTLSFKEQNISISTPSNNQFYILGYKKVIPSQHSLVSPGVKVEFLVSKDQKNPGYSNGGASSIQQCGEGMYYNNSI